jgi:hypothetical protein
MIDTMITQGAASSDCVGSSPAEAQSLAMSYSDAWAADIAPRGSHAGDLLDMSQASVWTPAQYDPTAGQPGPA